MGGRALFGPVGSAAARAVKGDVEKSLQQFVELYGYRRAHARRPKTLQIRQKAVA
jgi:hypothetical protein